MTIFTQEDISVDYCTVISGPPEPSDEEHDQPSYTELGSGRSSLYSGKSKSKSKSNQLVLLQWQGRSQML